MNAEEMREMRQRLELCIEKWGALKPPIQVMAAMCVKAVQPQVERMVYEAGERDE